MDQVIRQRDWNSTRSEHYQFAEERDLDNCVVERIIRNKFWDPLISSDEEEPIGPIDWDSIFQKKSIQEHQFRVFIPGFRKPPLHPKLSALTQDEHRMCMKVLCVENNHILPTEYIGRPSKADFRVFEEKKEIYAKEQQQYIEWAKQQWQTNCSRALRPKPIVELVYEAESKMKSHMVQCFPKTYKLAAQIPLRADHHNCEMTLPRSDLIEVNVKKLPPVQYPKINEYKISILRDDCPVPEPCALHACRFLLPNETEPSILPMTHLHKELAQFALDNGANFIASENSVKCLLETDQTWCLPLSVCEVIGPDGDTNNVVVLGSKFPDKREPAPVRSYRAFKHLLYNVFTSNTIKTENYQDSNSIIHLEEAHDDAAYFLRSPNRQQTSKKTSRITRPSFTAAARKLAQYNEVSDDSDDDNRLEIDLDEGSQIDPQSASEKEDQNHNSETKDSTESIPLAILKVNEEMPRRILRARRSDGISSQSDSQENTNIDKNKLNIADKEEPSKIDGKHSNSMNDESNKMDDEDLSEMNGQESSNTIGQKDLSQSERQDQFDIGLFKCVCKDSEFGTPLPRSYKSIQVKNLTVKEQVNMIVHSSHKLKQSNWSNEVILEPIIEYQLDIGGTLQSPEKILSLAFSLMMRKNSQLTNVRVDGVTGELVTMETCDLRALTSQHGNLHASVANTLYTALNQLAGLMPGHYLLKHEPSHGANAILYSRAPLGCTDVVPLQYAAALSPEQEATLVQNSPRLTPVLLPIHKSRRQLPLAFTYNKHLVVKESTHPNPRKKPPPAALQNERDLESGTKKKWPKRKGRNRRNKGKATN